MQEFELTIDLPNGETEDVVVPEGTTILELAKEYEAQFDELAEFIKSLLILLFI